jgi:hypothetical protein
VIAFAMDVTAVNFNINLSSATENRLLEIMIKYRTPEVGFSLVKAPGRPYKSAYHLSEAGRRAVSADLVVLC